MNTIVKTIPYLQPLMLINADWYYAIIRKVIEEKDGANNSSGDDFAR